MAPPIFTYLDDRIPVARHEHVAVLYRGAAAAFRFASFLAEGLTQGDVCQYLAPQPFLQAMLEQLRAQGVDVDRHLQARTLRLREGPADVAVLRQAIQQVFDEAENARAPAVRWFEDGIWPKPTEFPIPDFFEFHALLNYQVKKYPSVALCQYDLDQLEPRNLFSAIAVHRHLIVGDTLVRDNPFYIPAEKFLPLKPAERERDLINLFREVGFDVEKLLDALTAYGRLETGQSP